LIATDGASALGAGRERTAGGDHGGAARDAKEENNKKKPAQIAALPRVRLSRARRERFDLVVVFIWQVAGVD
jgi:hypothetical protein